MSDRTLLEIGKHARVLTRASFNSCRHITDRGVKALVENCVNLEEINLGSCENISNQSVTSIAAWLPLLKKLCLFCCSRITDTSILALGEKCLLLEYLDVSWCYRIEGKSLHFLAKRCKALKGLFLEGCPHISDLQIQNIVHVSTCLSESRVLRLNMDTAQLGSQFPRPCSSEQCVHRVSKRSGRSLLLRARSVGNVFSAASESTSIVTRCRCVARNPSLSFERAPAKGRRSQRRRRTMIQSSSFLLGASKPLESLVGNKVSTYGKSSPVGERKGSTMQGLKYQPFSESKQERSMSQSLYDSPESVKRRIWGESDSDVARMRAFSLSSHENTDYVSESKYALPNSPTYPVQREQSMDSILEEEIAMFKLDDA